MLLAGMTMGTSTKTVTSTGSVREDHGTYYYGYENCYLDGMWYPSMYYMAYARKYCYYDPNTKYSTWCDKLKCPYFVGGGGSSGGGYFERQERIKRGIDGI